MLGFLQFFVARRRFRELFCMPRSAFGEAKIWPEYPLSDWAATERGTRLTRMRMAMGFGVWLTVERVFACSPDNEQTYTRVQYTVNPAGTKVVPSLW
jgi:hypothetical protein